MSEAKTQTAPCVLWSVLGFSNGILVPHWTSSSDQVCMQRSQSSSTGSSVMRDCRPVLYTVRSGRAHTVLQRKQVTIFGADRQRWVGRNKNPKGMRNKIRSQPGRMAVYRVPFPHSETDAIFTRKKETVATLCVDYKPLWTAALPHSKGVCGYLNRKHYIYC